MKKIYKLIILTLLTILFFSCENTVNKEETTDISERNNDVTVSADGKTYITLGEITLDENARTINPEFDPNNFTSIKFSGNNNGNNNDFETSGNFQNMLSKTYNITPGYWKFTISGTVNGISYSGFVNKEIEGGTTNTISIPIQPSSNKAYGGLNIKVVFTGTADKVTATIRKKYSEGELIETLNYSPTSANLIDKITTNGDGTKQFTYSRNSNKFPAGKYYLRFDFYINGTADPLNTVEHIIRITNNFNTTATLNVDLNEVYTISYGYWEGSGEFFDSELTSLTFDPSNVVLPSVYSRKSETFTLPIPSLPGYTFDAWYKSSEYTDANKITEITQGSTGNLELYANFIRTISVTRINPEETLTTSSGDLIFEVSGVSDPENDVHVQVQYFDSGEDTWCPYDSNGDKKYTTEWNDNKFTLHILDFPAGVNYQVAFYDSDDAPLCSDYQFTFTTE